MIQPDPINMSNNKVQPAVKNPSNRDKKLSRSVSPQKNNLEKPVQQVPTSNSFRIIEQIRHLKTSKYRPTITKISQNRIEVYTKFELEKEIMRNGLGKSCIFLQQICEDTIEFVIVLHEMFPWCAPFLICTTQIMFPRLDDYRDYLEDVLEGQWWPNITVSDIIDLIPNFITRKIENSKSIEYSLTATASTSFDYGKRSFSQSLPHSLDCILRNCTGLKLCTGEYFNNQEVLMGKYEQIVVGMSWSDFVLFKPYNKVEDRYYVMKRWPVRQIKKISSKKLNTRSSKNKNNKVNPHDKEQAQEIVVEKYQFCLVLINGRKQYVKIKFGSQDSQQIDKQSQSVNMREIKKQKSEASKIRKKTSQKQCMQQGEFENKISKQIIFLEQQCSRADLQPQITQPQPTTIHHLPKINPPTTLTFLRHITQYIQLRQWVLGGDVGFESKIRMISQVIENSAELEEEVQIQLYYQRKLKEVINSQYMVRQADQITSKFQFDI